MNPAEIPSSAVRGIEARQVFQWLSYAQYPALLVTTVYMVQAVIALTAFRTAGWGPVFDLLNLVLLYGGVAIGLSSLQDPSKTQNKISRRVWMDPAKGRVLLWVLALEAFVPIALGLVGASLAKDTVVSQLALGLVAFGLGMIGLLKTAIEMREHHRLDRVPAAPPAAAGAGS
ncbi:hypothetical protein [Inhella proteolytica]|uniref:Uncharacterized protein n=1 Tax=Inhella proteolytica TaxID=2795029 RepID=A0A931NGA8_9BURK|nr:hypothetical protein [Inhella proteolytica]MBH9576961.1 hypothetical protein [Inhella proteolytica]